MTTSSEKQHAEQYRAAAERGAIDAQLSLGCALLYVPNTDDIAEGITWLRKVAEHDGSEGRYAQDMLASVYSRDLPDRYAELLKLMPAQDYHEALKWYRRRADAGSTLNMVLIGKLYERGTPATPHDFGEAFQWYTKASDWFELAEMHFHGRGVTQDYAEAARLYDKVRHGVRAMLRLGWLHENGKGVPQDLVEAHKWFNLAHDLGFGEAIRTEANAGRLRVEDALDAAQRAESWRRYEAVKDEMTAAAR